MPQLHVYLPKEIAEEVKRRASERQVSVSSYLAELVRSRVADEWPADYFSRVVGGWQGGHLRRPPQMDFEPRDAI